MDYSGVLPNPYALPTATAGQFTPSPFVKVDSPFTEESPATGNDGEPPKKKQKRNKPTLSCEECVERKTKVRKDCESFLIALSQSSEM